MINQIIFNLKRKVLKYQYTINIADNDIKFYQNLLLKESPNEVVIKKIFTSIKKFFLICLLKIIKKYWNVIFLNI